MRICVYARSAVDFDAGTSSIEQQKKYTAEYIRKNYPDAEFDEMLSDGVAYTATGFRQTK